MSESDEPKRVDCPVCGAKHEFESISSYEICHICGWEEDGVQRDAPNYSGGANEMSLNQARKAWSEGKKVE